MEAPDQRPRCVGLAAAIWGQVMVFCQGDRCFLLASVAHRKVLSRELGKPNPLTASRSSFYTQDVKKHSLPIHTSVRILSLLCKYVEIDLIQHEWQVLCSSRQSNSSAMPRN